MANLCPGAPADFVTLDLDRLDRDRIMPVDPLDLLFARGNASLLREVVVDGRTIVRDGRCLGVDLPAIETELREQYRANVGKLSHFQRAWQPLSASLRELVRNAAGVRLGTGRVGNRRRLRRGLWVASHKFLGFGILSHLIQSAAMWCVHIRMWIASAR